MWTENVTWFSNEEGEKGRIEVGQLADLMVPDRDYFSCAENEIADTTSDLTVVGGKVVYGAGDFAALDEAPLPPAMPDWSPVRSFGGYAAWGPAAVFIILSYLEPRCERRRFITETSLAEEKHILRLIRVRLGSRKARAT